MKNSKHPENYNDQNDSLDSSNERPWPIEDFNNDELVGIFLNDETEAVLPDTYDVKNVAKQQNATHCNSCSQKFNLLNRQKHCRYCGLCFCKQCRRNKRRLSKEDKKLYSVCDHCDTYLSNVNFTNMYKQVIEQQELETMELDHEIQKKQKSIKNVQVQIKKLKQELKEKTQEYQRDKAKRENELEKKQLKLDQSTIEVHKIKEKLQEVSQSLSKVESEINKNQNERHEIEKENYNILIQKQKIEFELKEEKEKLKNSSIKSLNYDFNGNMSGLQEKDGKEKKKDKEVGQMKRGDYMIHVNEMEQILQVFIEQAKQLKCPEGNTIDPLVEVSLLGQKKYTSAKDDIGVTGLCNWSEHLFFEPKNLDQETIESAKIELKVLDKGYFKDAVIGAYSFDVTYIYFMKDHSLMHKWIALQNPSAENFNEVAGYLKLSITIAGSGDEQVQITEDTGSDDSVLMPPSIRPEYYQIKFKFFRGEKLPAMDMAVFGKGSIDAYIKSNYLSKELKTKTITQKEGIAVEWDDEFLNGQFFWKNIYGAPLGYMGDNVKLMNANPESASAFKGRVLMQITAEKTEKPQFLVQPISEQDKELSLQYVQAREFEIIAEVGVGISLPDDEKFKVMIKIADFEMKTDKPSFAENTYNRWNCRFKQQTYKAPYLDVYDIGRVYVYLLQGDKPICYYKAEIEEFLDPDPKYKWVEMLPDLAVGKCKSPHKAGLISFKLSVHDKTAKGDINFEKFNAWKKQPPKRMPIQKVRAYIFQCRDLPAADSDGQSDPFITVWDSGKDPKKTRVIQDNLNPLFYETLELTYESISDKDLPPFILDIYDDDTLGADFVARCIIRSSEINFSNNDEVPRPQWFPCKVKPTAPACGEILIGFSVVPDDYNFKIPLKYMNLKEHVPFEEFLININILGLRDLQSVGILPVKKAYIVFNLKSLVPPDDGTALENIKTQPGDPGANPTINQSIKFNLPLPTDSLFCPRLSCTVHDYIFKGFSQPMIGSFVIPIGDLIHRLRKEREEETLMIENINHELDKILNEMGIQSYSIQEESNTSENLDNFAQEEQKKIRGTVKKSKVAVEDVEMQQPLLAQTRLEEIKKEEEEEKRKKTISPANLRVTPKQLRGSVDRKGTSVFKAQKFDKFNSGMKKQLLQEQQEVQEKAKRDLEQQRELDINQFKKSAGRVRNIVYPKYRLDERLQVYREYDQPPDSVYIGLGWDEKPEDKKKHYRRYFPDELENVKDIMPVPSCFDQYNLLKGQTRGASKGWWPFGGHKEDDSGEVSTEQVVGKFKGIVTVETEQEKHEYQQRKNLLVTDLKKLLNELSVKKTKQKLNMKLEQFDTMEGRLKFDAQMEKLGLAHLQITKHLVNLESDETLTRMLMAQQKCMVRVYIINAYDLSSRDNGSFSDPYLIVKLGKKVYNERNSYQLDNPNPDFHKSYDFEATFPGCPPLVIDVMDYDDLFGDDSIGKTSIDLEDRFFSPEWQSFKHKPVEYRQLYHHTSSVSQGVVKMWVEIHPTDIPMNDIPLFDITPKPAEEFEVRLVVWDTVDVICMDVEGTSDVYCRAFFDSREEVHETDTHYRCQNGKASFNYRLLYKIKYPRKDYALSVQVYDRDFFKSNDIIGESVLDLKSTFEDASLTKRPLAINKNYYNNYLKDKGWNVDFKDDTSFYIPINSLDAKTGQKKSNGKVRISIEIVPSTHAESNKVGEARQEPNHSPFLPPPVGRISFTLNPLKMFNQLVGPAMRRKIYCYCCIALCCALFIFMFPIVFGDLISYAITSIFK